jgi:hypothetical protein
MLSSIARIQTLSMFLWVKFWLITAMPKYLNYATFSNILFAISVSRFWPAFWWWDSNMYFVPVHTCCGDAPTISRLIACLLHALKCHTFHIDGTLCGILQITTCQIFCHLWTAINFPGRCICETVYVSSRFSCHMVSFGSWYMQPGIYSSACNFMIYSQDI